MYIFRLKRAISVRFFNREKGPVIWCYNPLIIIVMKKHIWVVCAHFEVAVLLLIFKSLSANPYDLWA